MEKTTTKKDADVMSLANLALLFLDPCRRLQQIDGPAEASTWPGPMYIWVEQVQETWKRCRHAKPTLLLSRRQGMVGFRCFPHLPGEGS